MQRQPQKKKKEDEENDFGALAVGALAIGGLLFGAYKTAQYFSTPEEPIQTNNTSFRYESDRVDEISQNLTPLRVRYTQDSITNWVTPPREKEGKQPFVNLLKDVLNEDCQPKIRIVYDDNQYWSIDNHRLYALQLYSTRYGDIDWEWYEIVPKDEEYSNKKQTKTEGRQITIKLKETSFPGQFLLDNAKMIQ
eukprot:TRINITY_DN1130_c0_g1_i2.p1 TRINITY_DN1130_c0_g1~~TRINITY_DN1130_c0_g1_i2.p1  ORF type:complete len:193 (+),score=54.77 TRINITY_DN1130_c0_g1_i2:41-619(+)